MAIRHSNSAPEHIFTFKSHSRGAYKLGSKKINLKKIELPRSQWNIDAKADPPATVRTCIEILQKKTT